VCKIFEHPPPLTKIFGGNPRIGELGKKARPHPPPRYRGRMPWPHAPVVGSSEGDHWRPTLPEISRAFPHCRCHCQARRCEISRTRAPTGQRATALESAPLVRANKLSNVSTAPPEGGLSTLSGRGGGSRFRVDKFDISRRISAMAQRTAALDPPCWKAPSGSLRPSDASRMAKNTTRSCGTGAT